jgi:hypothetical protein
LINDYQPHSAAVVTKLISRTHCDIPITDRDTGRVDAERAIILPFAAVVHEDPSPTAQRAVDALDIILRPGRGLRRRWLRLLAPMPQHGNNYGSRQHHKKPFHLASTLTGAISK